MRDHLAFDTKSWTWGDKELRSSRSTGGLVQDGSLLCAPCRLSRIFGCRARVDADEVGEVARHRQGDHASASEWAAIAEI
jgi:hypothetical protein